MQINFLAQIKQGKIVFKFRDYFDKYIKGTFKDDDLLDITVQAHQKKRSLDQNSYLWAEVYPVISESTGHTTHELHEIYKQMFLPKKFTKYKGQTIQVYPSTTKLSTKEFTEYIERIRAEVAPDGIIIPDPEK